MATDALAPFINRPDIDFYKLNPQVVGLGSFQANYVKHMATDALAP